MKFNKFLETTIKKDLEAGLSPMLLGDAGIGKSSFLENIGAELGTKVFVLACNQLADRADLTGARIVQDDKGTYRQEFFPHATIMDCIEYAEANPTECPILFLDEINRAGADITSAVLSFTTARMIGTMVFPENVRFVIAGNDKGNVTPLDAASRTRFSIYHVEPDTATFLTLDPNLHVIIREVLLISPELIACSALSSSILADTSSDGDNDDDYDFELELGDDEGFGQLTAPRTISYLSKWLNLFTDQELLDLIVADSRGFADCIIAKTGNTPFSAAIIEAATNRAINGSVNSVKGITVTKPQGYDTLKAIADVQKVQKFVSNMTDAQKSQYLVYMLQEKGVDNATFIEIVTKETTEIIAVDKAMLMQLASSDLLEKNNVDAFLAVNTNLTNKFAVILETI